MGLLGDVHDTTHEHPVTGEGADVGIVADIGRGGELDGFGAIRLHELGVDDDVGLGGFRNVALGHALRIGQHGVGECADGIEFTRLEEQEIVRLWQHATGVVERELHFLASLDAEFGLFVAQGGGGIRAGLEFDDGDACILRDGGKGECGDGGKEEAGVLHVFMGGFDGEALIGPCRPVISTTFAVVT